MLSICVYRSFFRIHTNFSLLFLIVLFHCFSCIFYKADSNRDSSLHLNFLDVSLHLLFFYMFFCYCFLLFFIVCFVVCLVFLIVCFIVFAAFCLRFLLFVSLIFLGFFIRQTITGQFVTSQFLWCFIVFIVSLSIVFNFCLHGS